MTTMHTTETAPSTAQLAETLLRLVEHEAGEMPVERNPLVTDEQIDLETIRWAHARRRARNTALVELGLVATLVLVSAVGLLPHVF